MSMPSHLLPPDQPESPHLLTVRARDLRPFDILGERTLVCFVTHLTTPSRYEWPEPGGDSGWVMGPLVVATVGWPYRTEYGHYGRMWTEIDQISYRPEAKVLIVRGLEVDDG